MKPITFATTALIIFSSLTISTPSFAKKTTVGNSTAVSLLTQCYMADDARDVGPEVANGCCSFSLGYCIECPDEKGEKCVKVSIRRIPPRVIVTTPESGVVAPTNVRDHRKAPKNGAVSAQ